MVLRRDQWLEPEDQTVLMYLGVRLFPASSGLRQVEVWFVRKLWLSVEAAVTWPLMAGAMMIVFIALPSPVSAACRTSCDPRR
jgi:hypothetical protein